MVCSYFWNLPHLGLGRSFATALRAFALDDIKIVIPSAARNLPCLELLALCGKNNAVLVLADRMDSSNVVVAEQNKSGIARGYVFGGPSAANSLLARAPICCGTRE